MRNIEEFNSDYTRNEWYWVWKEDSSTHIFVKENNDWDWFWCRVDIVDTDAQRDKAWEDVDLRDERIRAVRDWDTELWFDSWQENIDDIFDYRDPRDYYDYESFVYEQLEDRNFLDDWEIPDMYGRQSFTKDCLDYIDTEDEWDFDKDFFLWLCCQTWRNQIELILSCDDVR